jgi:hypothetical protein
LVDDHIFNQQDVPEFQDAPAFPSTTHNFQLEPGSWASGWNTKVVFGGTVLRSRVFFESSQLHVIVSCEGPAGLEHAAGRSADTHAWWYHLRKTQHRLAYQWRLFKVDPSYAKCPGSGTEIIPGKHPDTRIKPLPLTNGHGRYITVTTERTLVSVGECPLNI